MRMSNKLKTKKSDSEDGFSLVEAVVAIMILGVALIATAAAITYALQFSSISRSVTNGKLIAVSMIEEIDSLRNTRRLDFQQIANVGGVNNASSANTFNGFSTGFQEISLNPGPDGVNGTEDDLKDPGPDGKYSTADDFTNPALVKSGFMRQVTISSLNDNLKKIEVKVRYFTSTGGIGELTGVSYLNNEVRTTK
jgi:Tfp pilus assembly protein PilV